MISRKQIISLLWIVAVISSLCSCGNSMDSQELDTNEQIGDSIQEETSKEDYAKELIKTAFEYEIPNENLPTVDTAGDRTTIRYSSEPEKFYMVELDESLDFPAMVYYFSHIGEDEGFDLAKENTSYFNETMISNAQDFVEKLYGIDCSDATIHAYGYIYSYLV